MKAILHTSYGPPEELQVTEIEKPVPADNEILIKIQASSVTSSDCNVRNLTFVPRYLHFPVKMELGFKEPKNKILGFDLAGDVEGIGTKVTKFKIGDQIFGTTEPLFGAHAEYICLPESGVITHKPENISYEESATVPGMGNTALHFIRDLGKVQPGQKVLINGASGGIGTFAIQISKILGAEVTGVCSTANLDLVKSLGADYVIDYTQDDFTKKSQTYDVIFDAVGKSSFSQCKGSLKNNGLYLHTQPKFSVFLGILWTSIRGGKKVKMEGAPAELDNLLVLKEWIESGNLKTVLDKRYQLDDIAEAFRYVESGHKKGNVVIYIT